MPLFGCGRRGKPREAVESHSRSITSEGRLPGDGHKFINNAKRSTHPVSKLRTNQGAKRCRVSRSRSCVPKIQFGKHLQPPNPTQQPNDGLQLRRAISIHAEGKKLLEKYAVAPSAARLCSIAPLASGFLISSSASFSPPGSNLRSR
jgi:hypothetical protein